VTVRARSLAPLVSDCGSSGQRVVGCSACRAASNVWDTRGGDPDRMSAPGLILNVRDGTVDGAAVCDELEAGHDELEVGHDELEAARRQTATVAAAAAVAGAGDAGGSCTGDNGPGNSHDAEAGPVSPGSSGSGCSAWDLHSLDDSGAC
jgi:hypothetical protein